MKNLASVLIVVCTVGVSQAADWSQFRGPHGNWLPALEHPAKWNDEKQIAWKVDVPGSGWASPIVFEDRVFVTTAVDGQGTKPKGFAAGVASMGRRSRQPLEKLRYEVHCFRLNDGGLVWRRPVAEVVPPHRVHPSNSYATESPVATRDRVFVYFATIGLVVALDHGGNELWRKDVGAYPTSNDFGTGSSLSYHDGRIFLQCDNQEKSFVLAIDASNGNSVWRARRRGRTSWSSPFVWKNRLRTELVVCGSSGVTSYAVDSGKVLWQLSGLGGSFSATPAADEKRVYFGNSGPGRSGPLVAVNAGASGTLTLNDRPTDTGLAWVQSNSGPGLASPVSDGQIVYVTGRGILSAYDAATGERVYRARLGRSSIAASPWVAGDRLFVLDEAGETRVVQAGRQFKLLSTNSLPGLFWSTPSLAGECLMIRSATTLYCVRGASETTTASVNE